MSKILIPCSYFLAIELFSMYVSLTHPLTNKGSVLVGTNKLSYHDEFYNYYKTGSLETICIHYHFISSLIMIFNYINIKTWQSRVENVYPAQISNSHKLQGVICGRAAW